MKTKWGALIVDGRGKIGGQVASKNRSGSYMRNKVTPVNRKSTYQIAVRNRLTTYSQGWGNLTQTQRDSWNTAAASASFKKSNIFGDSTQPTGFNLYQKLNNNVNIGGGTLLSNPPAAVSPSAMASLSVVVTNGTPAITITYTPAIAAGDYVKVYATAGLSQGTGFVKSQFRLIGQMVTANASPYAALALYTARFGSVPAIGKKVFFKLIPVNKTRGFQGQALSFSTIISS